MKKSHTIGPDSSKKRQTVYKQSFNGVFHAITSQDLATVLKTSKKIHAFACVSVDFHIQVTGWTIAEDIPHYHSAL
jgi:hypothetical protein